MIDENTNNSRGGQPGNKNQSKNKPFLDALRRSIAQNPHKLRAAADKVVDKAEEGEPWAVNFLADRLDGKAIQTTELSGADGEPLTGIQVMFVKPNE
jgi:hypothetical protein